MIRVESQAMFRPGDGEAAVRLDYMYELGGD